MNIAVNSGTNQPKIFSLAISRHSSTTFSIALDYLASL
ncbi:MAG: hypothetical protein OFPII_34550 [Osedax symbiont Rs1]|nr:MAG: hypothetical protein OFPII_34550 [Osedax symbiont Rs1]